MKWQLLSGVLLLSPLVALGEPAALASPDVVLPWPDVGGRPVLHVGHVPDLKALLAAQSALGGLAGGHRIRLLGVSRSDAWFVTEDLAGKQWRDLLASEPRFRLVVPVADPVGDNQGAVDATAITAPSVETVIWDPDAAQLPVITPDVAVPVQSPL
ncbi:MAG TPA: hypothetical protein DF427_11950 [Moraxellaceae bacterium]|nr:hypothetical protein [Moraxellaceae bacterium]